MESTTYRRLRLSLASATLAGALSLSAAPYTVFDWIGKSAPTEPTFTGAVTTTTYVNGGTYFDTGTMTLLPMNVTIKVTAILDAPGANGQWAVDDSGTYGYQSAVENEFRFGSAGNPAAGVDLNYKFEIDFAQAVDKPSFYLMDIDNALSDKIVDLIAVDTGASSSYPTATLVPGSVVTVNNNGLVTMLLESNGGDSANNQALGSAFLKWSGNGITHLEFTYSTSEGTSLRLSNLESDAQPFEQVPEPSAWAAILALGGITVGICRRARK